MGIIESELFKLNDELAPIFTLPELEPVSTEPDEKDEEDTAGEEETRKVDLSGLPLFELEDGGVSGQYLECE